MNIHEKMERLIIDLNHCKLKKHEKINSWKEVLRNAPKFYSGKNLVVFEFEENIFPLPIEEMSQYEKWEEMDQKPNDKCYTLEGRTTPRDIPGLENEESSE